MSGVRIGEAFIEVRADSRSAFNSISRDARTAGQSSGRAINDGVMSGIGSAVATASKIVTGAVATIGGVMAATSLKGGFDRLLGIDQAQFKLKGLGYTTEEISGVMDDAMGSVKGTAFGLADAVTVASGALAAGVLEGDALQRTLSLVGDTAAIAGTDFNEMGTVFNQIAAVGKLTTENMQQLQDRGIPVLQYLSKEFGVTAEEAQRMVTEGEISFEEFQGVIEKNIGGAALAMGESWKGGLDNMKAAGSRVGATFLEPFFGLAGQVFKAVTPVLDAVNTALKPVMEQVGAALAPLTPMFEQFGASLAEKIGPAITKAGEAIVPLVEGFVKLLEKMGPAAPVIGMIGVALGALAPLIATVGPALVTFFGSMGGAAGATGTLGTVLRALLGPVAIIGGLLVAAYASSEPFRESINNLGGTFMDLFTTLGTSLVPVFTLLTDTLLPAITGLFDDLVPTLTIIVDAFSEIVTEVMGALIPAFASIAETIIPVIADVIAVVGEFATELIAELVPVVLDIIKTVLPALIDVFNDLVPVILDIVETVLPILIDLFKDLVPVVLEIVENVLPILVELFEALVPVIGDLIEDVLPPLVELFEELVPVIGDLIEAILPTLMDLFEELTPILTDIIDTLLPPLVELFEAVSLVITDVVEALAPMVATLADVLIPLIENLMPVVTTVFEGIAEVIGGAVEVIGGIIKIATGLIKGDWDMVWNGIKDVFSGIWEVIKATLGTAFEALWEILGAGLELLKQLWGFAWTWIKDEFGKIWEGIKNVLSTVWEAIVSFISTGVEGFKNIISTAFNWVRDTISNIWNGIKDTISNVWVHGIKPVFDAVSSFIKEDVPNAFQTGVDKVKGFWDGLKKIASDPIKFLIDTVYNNGIRGVFNKVMEFVGSKTRLPELSTPEGFRKGGYTGNIGKDDVAGVVHGKEYVFTAEQTAAIGKDKLAALAKGHAAIDGGAAANGSEFGALWGGFQNRIKAAGKVLVNQGAGSAWQIPQAAAMWDRLAGLRVGAGSGQPNISTMNGSLGGGILAWANSAGDITFNNSGMAPGLNPNMKKATAAHEIGHVLGLPHTNAASIMQPVMGPYLQPTPFDMNRLRSLYPGGSRDAGSDSGGGFFDIDPVKWVTDKISEAIDGLLAKIPGAGKVLDMAMGTAKKLVGDLKDWGIGQVKDFLHIDGSDGDAARAPKTTLFDGGGLLEKGMIGIHGKSTPDKVLTDAQWNSMKTLADSAANGANSHGTINNNTYYVTLDAKNVKDFNDVVNMVQNVPQVARSGRGTTANARIA